MGSNKPHQRGKTQRRDKIKPVIQHNTQPRPTTVGTPHAAPAEPVTAPPPLAAPAPPAVSEPAQQDVTGAIVPVVISPTPEPIDVEPVPAAEPEYMPPATVPVLEPELSTESLPEPASVPLATVPHTSSEPAPVRHGGQKTPTPPSELTPMFTELRELFMRDRAFASRQDTARCGICYLTFARDQLVLRETDGFYACPTCEASLGHQQLPMLRRQRK